MICKNLTQLRFLFGTLPKNPYKVLGLNQGASEQQIKNAYYKLAKQYHPDVKPQNEQTFKEINEAYSTLKDPLKRSTFDRPSSSQSQQSQHQSDYNHDEANNEKYHQYHKSSRNWYQQEMFRRKNMNYHQNFSDDPFDMKRQDFRRMRRQYARNMFWQRYIFANPQYMSPMQFFFLTSLIITAILTIGSVYLNLKRYDQLQKQAYRYERLPYPGYPEEDDEFY